MSHRIPIEPVLDLHRLRSRAMSHLWSRNTSRAAHEAGLREVRLIHGRGKGVQRGIVQATLERHPLVEGVLRRAGSHLGATVAVLDVSRAEGRG